jgi:Eukaryotic aspartyl protease
LTFAENPNKNANYWVLGQSFLRAYYAIHDMDQYRVGLAGKFIDLGPPIIPPNITSSASVTTNVKDWWNGTVMWIAVGVAGFLALLMIIVGIYYFCCKKEDSSKIAPPSLSDSTGAKSLNELRMTNDSRAGLDRINDDRSRMPK